VTQVDLEKFRDYAEKVRLAAENKKYKWRTIDGIATESGVAPEIVSMVITTNTDTFVKSTVPSTAGKSLFTTRKHFLETATTTEKLVGAIKNRLG